MLVSAGIVGGGVESEANTSGGNMAGILEFYRKQWKTVTKVAKSPTVTHPVNSLSPWAAEGVRR